MREYQRLIQLAGNIYDAVIDSTHWPDVLANIACFVGGQACLLILKSSADRSANIYHQFGIDARYLRLYVDAYCDLDPLTMLPGREPESIASISNLAPLAEFRKSAFYRDWLRPQGLLDALSVALAKTGAGYASLCVMRGEADGMADDEMRRRIRLSVPHLRRALAVEQAIELRQTEAATFADILDNLSAGIFLVDADGGIVHANAAGSAIQRSGNFLRAVRGRLTANDGQADHTLRAIFAAAGGGAVDRKGVALPLNNSADPMSSSMMRIFTRHGAAHTMALHATAAASYAAQCTLTCCRQLLAALDRSREREAARVIARYRHLIADDFAATVFEAARQPARSARDRVTAPFSRGRNR